MLELTRRQCQKRLGKQIGELPGKLLHVKLGLIYDVPVEEIDEEGTIDGICDS
jgi:hypothetical protein